MNINLNLLDAIRELKFNNPDYENTPPKKALSLYSSYDPKTNTRIIYSEENQKPKGTHE